MTQHHIRFLFLNLGHAFDHLFMLLFPTVVLALETDWERPFSELLPLSVGGFIAFGVGAVPAGWLGDRWSRRHMMTVFFIGIGAASILAGLASGPLGLAVALTLIGLFASIYHPVGVAMVVEGTENVGRRLGVNGVAGNLGVAAAALTAGALVDLIHWRAAFIIPGIVSIAAGLGFLLVTRGETRPEATGAKAARAVSAGLQGNLVRVFIVLGLVTLFAGLIFNATLVSLPKVFAVRLGELATSTLGVSSFVSLVYVVGALAQIFVGMLLDRYPAQWILMAVAGAQVPFLLLASQAHNWGLVIVATAMMLTIFGAIPIQDTIVARSAAEAWRSRVYALKYLIALGVSSLAVPMVSVIYGSTGEFVWLFGAFAGLSLVIVAISLLLPRMDAPAGMTGATPAPAQSGGGD